MQIGSCSLIHASEINKAFVVSLLTFTATGVLIGSNGGREREREREREEIQRWSDNRWRGIVESGEKYNDNSECVLREGEGERERDVSVQPSTLRRRTHIFSRPSDLSSTCLSSSCVLSEPTCFSLTSVCQPLSLAVCGGCLHPPLSLS